MTIARRPLSLVLVAAALLGGPAIALAAEPSAPEITRVDRAVKPTEPGTYPAEMVEPGAKRFDGSYREAPQYRSRSGKVTVAIWQSGPGTLKTDAYPHEEYCLVLEGRVNVTNRSGRRETFEVGDSFVIPKGWAGRWEMPVRFKKQYVAFEE